MGNNTQKNNDWIRKNKERISLVIKEGTKSRIRGVLMPGESVNSFIERLVLSEIDERENKKFFTPKSTQRQEPETTENTESGSMDPILNEPKNEKFFDAP